MAIYFVTGKLGSGKTLCAVGRIQEYLERGCKVATNLDLKLENMLDHKSEATVTRLPDKPRLQDLEMLGRGYEEGEIDEKKNGLLVLDECLDFLDSRSWRDKERAPVLSWMRHARKLRWDVYFLLQDIESADGQLVRQLCEHIVFCRRTDRVRFLKLKLPKMHIAAVHYGQSITAPFVERWIYKNANLYDAYDTEQCFTDETEYLNEDWIDMRAPYTLLSPYHLEGRYMEPPKKIKKPRLDPCPLLREGMKEFGREVEALIKRRQPV
jgi:hypothetical protein